MKTKTAHPPFTSLPPDIQTAQNADAEGIDHVFVNGIEIARSGEQTGARPGAMIRSGRDTETVKVPGAR